MITIGQKYNTRNDSFEIINISKKASVLTAKSLTNGKILKFKWFDRTGKYVEGKCNELIIK